MSDSELEPSSEDELHEDVARSESEEGSEDSAVCESPSDDAGSLDSSDDEGDDKLVEEFKRARKGDCAFFAARLQQAIERVPGLAHMARATSIANLLAPTTVAGACAVTGKQCGLVLRIVDEHGKKRAIPLCGEEQLARARDVFVMSLFTQPTWVERFDMSDKELAEGYSQIERNMLTPSLRVF